MWMIKANTTILIDAPFGRVGGPRTVPSSDGTHSLTDTAPWKAYITKEDRIYEKEQVYDYVRVHNGYNLGGESIPAWIAQTVLGAESGHGGDGKRYVVVSNKGQWAKVNISDIQYLD